MIPVELAQGWRVGVAPKLVDWEAKLNWLAGKFACCLHVCAHRPNAQLHQTVLAKIRIQSGISEPYGPGTGIGGICGIPPRRVSQSLPHKQR
jgi:hypothetical protein